MYVSTVTLYPINNAIINSITGTQNEDPNVETSPGGVETELMGNKYDIIACFSPVYQDYDIPKVNAVGMLTGMAEKQVIEDCLKILEG